MFSDTIGQQEGLLPINQNYDEIWGKKLDIGYTFSEKPKKTVYSAKCETTGRAHDAFCPLIQV